MKKFLPIARGFTLIELLVVISIIGMLSTVVFASLSGARQKGEVGAGYKFATHNLHVLGAEALGIWNFDEASGDAINEANIGGTNMQVGSLVRSTDTPGTRGRSVVHGVSSSVPAVTYPTQTSALNGTFSAWIKNSGTQTNSTILPLAATSVGGITVAYISLPSGSSARCFSASISAVGGIYPTVNNLVPDRWYHIACSYDYTAASPKVNLYVNGRLASTATLPSGSAVSGLSVRLATTFTGNIDDAAIYTSPLAARDIERIYAEGLPAHTLASDIK